MSESPMRKAEILSYGPDAETTGELWFETRNRLLAPDMWEEPLTKYANATRLAVALVNPERELIGEVFNARPLWALLAKYQLSGPCPFSVSSSSSCTCVADAFSRGKPVIVKDDCGLVHFSAPLVLNGYRLGAVMAGQVFDQHPESLPLERLARRSGIDGRLWELARLELPVRAITLQVYADMLATFADAVLQGGYSRIQAERLSQSQAQIEQTEVALESTKEELQALAARLLKIQDEERRRVAREIHDDIIQRLALLSIKSTSALKMVPAKYREARRQLKEIERDAAALSDDMRRVAYHLHPARLEDFGLPMALKTLAREFEEAHKVPVSFTVRRFPESVSSEVSLCLYRIAQESLQNASRHAGSAPVAVILSGVRSGVRLAVCDKGRGFDPNIKRSGGLGLINMRERVRLARGTLKIRSRPGRGASVIVWVPLSAPGWGLQRKLADSSPPYGAAHPGL